MSPLTVTLANSDDEIVVSISMETWMFFQRRELGCHLFDAAQENRAAAYLERYNVPFIYHGRKAPDEQEARL